LRPVCVESLEESSAVIRICNVVSQDGFDLDVLANLIAFYATTGYVVVPTTTPIKRSDLLVLKRGVYTEAFSGIDTKEVHVYDYTGVDNAIYNHSFSHIPRRCYISSNPKSLKDWVVINDFHPVVPELWSGRSVATENTLIHIGNYKPQQGADPIYHEFLSLLERNSAIIWGRGWDGLEVDTRGSVSLSGCIKLYRRYKKAVGYMYLWQRDHYISGRMWLAPLNGCAIFSEETAQLQFIPGVYHYSDVDIRVDSEEIAAEARKFWSEKCAALSQQILLREWHGPARFAKIYAICIVSILDFLRKVRWVIRF